MHVRWRFFKQHYVNYEVPHKILHFVVLISNHWHTWILAILLLYIHISYTRNQLRIFKSEYTASRDTGCVMYKSSDHIWKFHNEKANRVWHQIRKFDNMNICLCTCGSVCVHGHVPLRVCLSFCVYMYICEYEYMPVHLSTSVISSILPLYSDTYQTALI